MKTFNSCFNHRKAVTPVAELHTMDKAEYNKIPDIVLKNPDLKNMHKRFRTKLTRQDKLFLSENIKTVNQLFEKVSNKLNPNSTEADIKSIGKSLMYGKGGNPEVDVFMNSIPHSEKEKLVDILCKLLDTNYLKDTYFQGRGFNHETASKTKLKIEALPKLINQYVDDYIIAATRDETVTSSLLASLQLSTHLSNIIKLDNPAQQDLEIVNGNEVAKAMLSLAQHQDKQYILEQLSSLKDDYRKEFEEANQNIAPCTRLLEKYDTKISELQNQHAIVSKLTPSGVIRGQLKVLTEKLNKKIQLRDRFQIRIDKYKGIINKYEERIKALNARMDQLKGSRVTKPLHDEIKSKVAFKELIKTWQPKIDELEARKAYQGTGDFEGTDYRLRRDLFVYGNNEILDPKDSSKLINISTGTIVKFAGEEYQLILPEKPSKQSELDVIRFINDFISSNPKLVENIKKSNSPDATMEALVSNLTIGMRQCIGNVGSDVISLSNTQELATKNLFPGGWHYSNLVVDLNNSTIEFTNVKLLVNSPGHKPVEIPIHNLSFKIDKALNPKFHMLKNGSSLTGMNLNGHDVDLTEIVVPAGPSGIIKVRPNQEMSFEELSLFGTGFNSIEEFNSASENYYLEQAEELMIQTALAHSLGMSSPTSQSAATSLLEQIADDEDDFVMLDDNPITKQEADKLAQENKRQTAGLLSGSEISTIINTKLGYKNAELDKDLIVLSGNNKVIIKPHVTGKEEINTLLPSLLKSNNYQKTSALTLIPYGVTNRGFGAEDHSVLIAIYNDKVFVIDPKSISISGLQIDSSIPHKVTSKGLQGPFDTTNCGRYTAYTAIYLAQEFLKFSAEYNLLKTLNNIPKPLLSGIQKEYISLLQGQ